MTADLHKRKSTMGWFILATCGCGLILTFLPYFIHDNIKAYVDASVCLASGIVFFAAFACFSELENRLEETEAKLEELQKRLDSITTERRQS